jgi:hypothetical protein
MCSFVGLVDSCNFAPARWPFLEDYENVMRKSASWWFGESIRTAKAKSPAMHESEFCAGRAAKGLQKCNFSGQLSVGLCHSNCTHPIPQEKQP